MKLNNFVKMLLSKLMNKILHQNKIKLIVINKIMRKIKGQ
jgi:hypothetical protein